MKVVEQRRYLVLLFCDLVDSTRIAAHMEPEQYSELLSELRRLTETIVARHGGQIARIDGDGCLCLFGYPTAYEDGGRRATEAALDLHSAISSLHRQSGFDDRALLLHSGVHAGVVLLRSGDIVRGRFEMLGDATNVAARLCDAAQPGTILVSTDTLGPDRHFFIVDASKALTVSGHGAAIRTLVISGRSDVPHRFAARTRDGLSPFVGRQEQCAQVIEWLSDDRAHPVMLVSGPAGIGKSRLTGHVASEARDHGWRIFRGYCEAYMGTEALQPFKQIGAALSNSADSIRTADRIGSLHELVASTARDPLLLMIDDWQWSDDASRDFLSALLDTAALPNAAPLRIVLASREPDPRLPPEHRWSKLPLQPLDDRSIGQTVATLLPSPQPALVSRIITASGGSPLLVEELCHAFAAGETEPASAPRGAWFDLTVQARLAKISSADGNALQCAAVIGNILHASVLTAVLGHPLKEAMLDRLQASDFLFRGDDAGTLRFKHGLTRDAIYAGIGRAQRLALHARVADALLDIADEDVIDAASLARHLAASEQGAAALPWWLKAGDAALAAGSLDRAQFHFGAAFAWLDRDDLDQGEITALRHVIRRFGRACVIDPSREHVALLDRMKARADAQNDIEALALATYWIGAHFYGLGEPRRSLAALDKAMVIAEPLGSASFSTQIRANLGQTNAIAARYDDAIPHMDEAITAKQAARKPGQPSSSLAYCLSSRGLVLADIGHFARAHADFDAAEDALENSDDAILPSLVTQRCLALIYEGRFTEAAERAEWSEQRANASRARFLVFSARALGSYARWLDTSEQGWFDRFAATVVTLHQSQRFQRISYKYGWMAEAMAERGESAMARAFAALAFRRALKGDRLGEASAARGLAMLSACGGTVRPFAHYLDMAARAARIRRSPREEALNRLCAARCLTLLGRDGDALIETDKAASAFERLGMSRWASAIGTVAMTAG